MSDALVPLCICSGLGQAQMLRASLEARGVPTLIDGEYQSNTVLTGITGSVIGLRIMIPRSQLRLGYALALELIPDLPEPEFDAEFGEAHARESMPLRRAVPEDLVAYPDDDQQALALSEDEDELGDEIAELPEQRTLFAPRVGFGLGLVVAILVMVSGYVNYGVVITALTLVLAYVRVLPITTVESD